MHLLDEFSSGTSHDPTTSPTSGKKDVLPAPAHEVKDRLQSIIDAAAAKYNKGRLFCSSADTAIEPNRLIHRPDASPAAQRLEYELYERQGILTTLISIDLPATGKGLISYRTPPFDGPPSETVPADYSGAKNTAEAVENVLARLQERRGPFGDMIYETRPASIDAKAGARTAPGPFPSP